MTNFFPRLSAWVELPPCGYKVFSLAHGDPPAPEAYRNFVSVSNSGFGISSLKAEDGAELLAAPIGLVVISDTSDTWAHGINEFRQEMGRPTLVSSTVIENGPVTRITRQRASLARLRDRSRHCTIRRPRFRRASLRHRLARARADTQARDPYRACTAENLLPECPGRCLNAAPMEKKSPIRIGEPCREKSGTHDYTVALLNTQTYSYDCLNGAFSHRADSFRTLCPP